MLAEVRRPEFTIFFHFISGLFEFPFIIPLIIAVVGCDGNKLHHLTRDLCVTLLSLHNEECSIGRVEFDQKIITLWCVLVYCVGLTHSSSVCYNKVLYFICVYLLSVCVLV